MKILDYQLLVPGHPALDIWDIIYSATDAAYRAQDMEEDLRAYYAILSGYMEDKVDYAVFRQELADRRVKGVVMTSGFEQVKLLLNTSQVYLAWQR